MTERRVVVSIAEGLHARPAALFARLAAGQVGQVTVRRPEGRPVPAASVLSIMTLGARAGDELVLEADDETALDTLADFLRQADPGGQG